MRIVPMRTARVGFRGIMVLNMNKRSLTLPAPWGAFYLITVGDVDRAEFGDVLRSVREFPESRTFADLVAFETWTKTIATLPIVDAIVLLQSYTGEHPRSVLDRIRRKFPVTPVVSVLGCWCEGELRTGWPLAATHRIYGNDWIVQGEKELFALAKREFSLFGLPPTSKDEDVFLEQAKRKTFHESVSDRRCWIFTCHAISRPDFEMSRLLQTRMRRFGFQADVVDWENVSDFPQQPDTVLWEPGLVDEKSFGKIVSALRQLRAKVPGAKIVLFLDSPRIDERETLYAAGADRICSKIPPGDSFLCPGDFL